MGLLPNAAARFHPKEGMDLAIASAANQDRNVVLPGGDNMISRMDKMGTQLGLLLLLGLPACGKIDNGKILVETPVSTDFFASTVLSPSAIASAPSINELKTGDGFSFFFSDGGYEDQLDFSNGGAQDAVGSYTIDPDGRMYATTSMGTLRGAVNPAEDFLYTIRGNGADASQQLTLAASPFGFPSGSLPDFTGSYTFLGVRFFYSGGAGFDLPSSARTIFGTMSILHDQLLQGSFFFTGADSAGNAVAFQGSFTLDSNDLTLHFFLDGVPGETWNGSFAPSGLLLLNDRSLGNGDAGNYAAILHAGFAGPGPLGFDGRYSVAKFRFFADGTHPFGTSVQRTVRDYAASGVYSENCDLPFACIASWSNVPYTLNVDGNLSQEEPELLGTVDGAISEDLGVFLAVEMGKSSGSLPQEIALVVGTRLLP